MAPAKKPPGAVGYSVRESGIVKPIVKYLKKRGGVVFKMHGGRFQVPGIPDIHYAERGVTVWFEVKKPDEAYGVTPLQAKVMNQLKAQKIPCFVVHSVEEVADILNYGFPDLPEVKQDA